VDGLFAILAREGVASVCQVPVGMKQNCKDPESLTLRRTSDNTSSSPACLPAFSSLGFSINSFGNPAKDAAPPWS
jgi:hypothetical protein